MSSDAAERQAVATRRRARWSGWRSALVVVAVVATLAAGAWSQRFRLLQAAADLWVVSDPVTRSDAAVVLGGGVETRPFVAADLYRRGLVRRVLVSSVREEPSDQLGVTEDHTDLNIAVLEKLGVPAAAIETFGKDNDNTADEAVALRAWARLHGARSFVIPSDVFMTRRARWIFRRELGPGIRVAVTPAPSRLYDRVGWWRKEDGVVAFQNEVVKSLYYRVRY